MRIELNRTCGGFPYEIHLDVRVNGKDRKDALDSVIEMMKDHRNEILQQMYPDKMNYPPEDDFE